MPSAGADHGADPEQDRVLIAGLQQRTSLRIPASFTPIER
jgi:hypothetical protein